MTSTPKFRYKPTFQAAAIEAFKEVDGDHTDHRLSSQFVAIIENRDRDLEDYLDNLPAPSGGGDLAFYSQFSISIPGAGGWVPPLSWATSNSFTVVSPPDTSTLLGAATIGSYTLPGVSALVGVTLDVNAIPPTFSAGSMTAQVNLVAWSQTADPAAPVSWVELLASLTFTSATIIPIGGSALWTVVSSGGTQLTGSSAGIDIAQAGTFHVMAAASIITGGLLH